ncbi:MAG: glycoside hydrolase family 2 TIM barrel-domain containing protein, partial [Rikenellaceae bacterium]
MKKELLLTALALCLSLTAANAEQVPNIQNIPNRNITKLDGNWKCIVDPFENGYYNYRLKPYDGGYAQDHTYSDKRELQEYDFETSQELHVPGDWNTQRPQLYYYEGTVWYRKRFSYDLAEDKRLFLHFEAANYETRVWLNGKPLGSHIGGYTPFSFEITDKLVAGENSVVVKVDNKRNVDAVPTINSDWWNYGGLTRSVELVETPKSFIEDYYLQLKDSETKVLKGRVELNGATGAEKVTLKIPELKITKEYTTDAEGIVEFEIKAKPELWSPENPKLYDVELSSASDNIDDRIGFRTIETRGKDILLNGEKIFCRGVCIHEERAGDSGRAYSADHARTLLGWAKEMGCNFVRLAHYPHNEAMIREAERMGLMVWSEIPVYWTISWENEQTYQNAERQLSDMIDRDKNRCNIIIWSIANETPHGDARLKFLTRLANKARSMDDVRLIAAAMEKSRVNGSTMTVKDDLGDLLDIISFNQYVGWYEGDNDRPNQVNWIFDQDKPVFLSEFGGGALYGHHGASDERFTEDYQRVLYENLVKMFDRMDGLAGTAPWVLKDFRSPRRQVPNLQDDFNRKGLVSDKGEYKEAFYVMQEW